jgi:hypothetical protein
MSAYDDIAAELSSYVFLFFIFYFFILHTSLRTMASSFKEGEDDEVGSLIETYL